MIRKIYHNMNVLNLWWLLTVCKMIIKTLTKETVVCYIGTMIIFVGVIPLGT